MYVSTLAVLKGRELRESGWCGGGLAAGSSSISQTWRSRPWLMYVVWGRKRRHVVNIHGERKAGFDIAWRTLVMVMCEKKKKCAGILYGREREEE